ncbi:hypothetical protein V7S43_018134 [Phytophthora oleae]|uniref:CRAL-TRIO domain-containing protein n=1 Tax=Phytophthora oleae TaxID=2107226 RepID=A0ABD3EV84_9STRA
MNSSYGNGLGPNSFGGYGQYSGHHPTPLQALASAVALPDTFTDAEMIRTLQRNNGDVMRAALQLKEKNSFRKEMHYLELNVGLPTLQEEVRKGYVHFLEGATDTEGCPVLLLQLQYFKPGFGDGQKLQRQGRGAADGSAASSLEDARRLCVYLMDLAVEAMEEKNAPGIVFIIDIAHCTLANLEAKMVTDILQVCKKWYPEVVKRILVVNSSALSRVLTLLLTKMLGARTQQKIRILGDPRELSTILPHTAIPQPYGGGYPMMHPNVWLKKQAELEGVDLDAAYVVQDEDAEEDKGYGLEEREIDPNESLNGMQYANVSAVDAAEMPNSVLRGPLMRKKTDGVWAKHFALLRPEAVLLYENATGVRPIIIIPVNYEVRVVAATFPDRPKGCGFRIEVPGIVGGHELVATSEQERGNWLQELQWAVDNNREKVERREEREERRAKIHRDFDALNMINFDVELPIPPPPKAADTLGTQQQMQYNAFQQPMQMGMQPTSFGMQQMQMGMQPAISLGMQQQSMGMQQPMQMPMQQQTMPMGMQQPLGMGFQQQTMQMQMQPGASQGLNVPASSGYQLNSKSLQDQLLNNFRG